MTFTLFYLAIDLSGVVVKPPARSSRALLLLYTLAGLWTLISESVFEKYKLQDTDESHRVLTFIGLAVTLVQVHSKETSTVES